MAINLDDKNEVADFIEKAPGNYFYVRGRLKNDDEITRVAINAQITRCSSEDKEQMARLYQDESLRDDEETMLKIIKIAGQAFDLASDRLKNSKEFIIKVVKYQPECIYLVDEKYRDDKDIALAALSEYGDVLECLSDRLKDDEEVVMAAIKSKDCGENIVFNMSDRLKNDRDFILGAVKIGGNLAYVDGYEDDKEVVMAALESNFPPAINNVSDRLRDDKDVVRAAMTSPLSEGYDWEYASDRIRFDKKFLVELIQQNPKILIAECVELTDDMIRQLLLSQQLKIQQLDAELRKLKAKETQAQELLGAYEQQVPSQQHEEN